MTRIRALGFSLKAFSAKLRRLLSSHPYRIAGSGFLITVLIGGLIAGGCVPSQSGSPGTGEIPDFVNKGFEMENVRFEPQGLPFSIQPACAFWLRRGDTIAPKWDTHEHHWERKGAMCEFPDNISTADCQICDYCNPPPSFDGEPCMGIHPFYSPGLLEVVADPGFIPTDNPQTILTYFFRGGDVFGACANDTQHSLKFFEPAASGLYRFRQNKGLIFKGATNGEIKIHVVERGAGLAQQAHYKLMRETVDGVDYWTFTMDADPLWLENFSQNLRVTDIRIFKGACVPDPAQGKQCMAPSGNDSVKPSRILFLPDFQGTVSGHAKEGANRCYTINPGMNDVNFINLVSCRGRYDDPIDRTIEKSVTPTYDPGDYQAATGTMPEIFPKKLTWLVEFNFAEGADADLRTPTPDAWDPMNNPIPSVLIIEFTIQAKD